MRWQVLLVLVAAGTVANDYRIDHRFVAIFLVEFGFNGCDERFVEVILHQIHGATAKSATHDA